MILCAVASFLRRPEMWESHRTKVHFADVMLRKSEKVGEILKFRGSLGQEVYQNSVPLFFDVLQVQVFEKQKCPHCSQMHYFIDNIEFYKWEHVLLQGQMHGEWGHRHCYSNTHCQRHARWRHVSVGWAQRPPHRKQTKIITPSLRTPNEEKVSNFIFHDFVHTLVKLILILWNGCQPCSREQFACTKSISSRPIM